MLAKTIEESTILQSLKLTIVAVGNQQKVQKHTLSWYK
jgi:hypothetical protein